MRGVYVLSYPRRKSKIQSTTVRGFKRKGIRFVIYVAYLTIKGERVEVVVL